MFAKKDLNTKKLNRQKLIYRENIFTYIQVCMNEQSEKSSINIANTNKDADMYICYIHMNVDKLLYKRGINV